MLELLRTGIAEFGVRTIVSYRRCFSISYAIIIIVVVVVVMIIDVANCTRFALSPFYFRIVQTLHVQFTCD